MDILSHFSENLKELIEENDLSVENFAATVGIAYSEIYRYLNKKYLPKLSNLIKIADRYNCSIDYLLGYLAYPPDKVYKTTPPFSKRFRELLEERSISRYRLGRETNISTNRLDDWYYGKFTPSLHKVQKLAKYYGCSLDYLLGRV